jgi:hypothetical protein
MILSLSLERSQPVSESSTDATEHDKDSENHRKYREQPGTIVGGSPVPEACENNSTPQQRYGMYIRFTWANYHSPTVVMVSTTKNMATEASQFS